MRFHTKHLINFDFEGGISHPLLLELTFMVTCFQTSSNLLCVPPGEEEEESPEGAGL